MGVGPGAPRPRGPRRPLGHADPSPEKGPCGPVPSVPRPPASREETAQIGPVRTPAHPGPDVTGQRSGRVPPTPPAEPTPSSPPGGSPPVLPRPVPPRFWSGFLPHNDHCAVRTARSKPPNAVVSARLPQAGHGICRVTLLGPILPPVAFVTCPGDAAGPRSASSPGPPARRPATPVRCPRPRALGHREVTMAAAHHRADHGARRLVRRQDGARRRRLARGVHAGRTAGTYADGEALTHELYHRLMLSTPSRVPAPRAATSWPTPREKPSRSSTAPRAPTRAARRSSTRSTTSRTPRRTRA